MNDALGITNSSCTIEATYLNLTSYLEHGSNFFMMFIGMLSMYVLCIQYVALYDTLYFRVGTE